MLVLPRVGIGDRLPDFYEKTRGTFVTIVYIESNHGRRSLQIGYARTDSDILDPLQLSKRP